MSAKSKKNSTRTPGTQRDTTNDDNYPQTRMQDAVVAANLNYSLLMAKYGYLIGHGNKSKIRKSIDLAKSLIVCLFLLIPSVSFWFIILLNIFIWWAISLKFSTYSLSEYISLFLGNCRLYLLQFENKYSIFWNILHRIIGFGQLFEFIIFTKNGKVLTLFERYKTLFKNYRQDTEAFPFLSSIVTTRYDIAYELIHKPKYTPTKGNDKDAIFCDREGKTVFMNESGSFFPMVGIPAVLSIADGRHDIGRQIVYIMLNINSKDEYMDFKSYYDTKFRKFPSDTDQWLKKFLGFPRLKQNFNGVYFALTFYRLFGYKMTNKEIIYLNKNWPLIALCALPDWFVFILFNNAIPRNCFIAIDWLSNIIKTKCKHCRNVQNLINYSKNMGFKNENIVFYIASLSFFLMGGNLLIDDCYERFKLNPKKEYYKFITNKELYVKETYRTNAAMVKAVSQLSNKPYTFKIKNKLITFPPRTIIGVSLVHINDSLPGYKSDHHIVPRPSRRGPNENNIYNDQLTFNLKDEYFHNPYEQDKMMESERFCPGRIIIDPHLQEVFEIVFKSLKQTYKID